MLRKILKITTPLILISIILLIAFDSYKEVTRSTENPLNIIPTNAALILQCNNANNLHSNLNSTAIWGHLRDISIIDSISNEIKEISSFYNKNSLIFKDNTVFISFHKVGVSNSGILFSSTFDRNSITSNIQINSLLGNLIKEREYNNQPLYELKHNDNILYLSFKGDIVFFSENKMLVEDAIRASVSEEKLLIDPNFNTAYKTINKSAEINLFFNYNSLIKYANIFTNKSLAISNFSAWTASDLNVNNNIISANGFSAFNNSNINFTDIFRDQSIEKINILDVIPKNTTLLLSIGYDNPKQLLDKKNKILQYQNNLWSWNKHSKLILDSFNVNYNEFINEMHKEAGIFNTSANLSAKQKYSFFKTNNSITAISLLQGLISDISTYGSYNINKVNDANITAQLFGDIFNSTTPYFITIEDYFIFGSSIASLEYLIDNYKSNNTLSKSKHFNDYRGYLSSKSNLLFYVNPGKSATFLKEELQTIYRKNIDFNLDSIEKFTAFTLQMSRKKDLLFNNINMFYDSDFKEAIKEEWFLQLDTSISMHPQFVFNHFTKEKMILLQNNNNKVFAINSKGEQLWNIQLNSKILGDISSIDFYKNNKYQYLFNTESKLYLIDRNGENVNEFPVDLSCKTSFGHSLFDYNNNRRYRILIVGEDNNIYNLNKKGKEIKGWKYEKNNNIINNKIQYFKVGTKDYILAERNSSSTQLLAINGSERVNYEKNILFNGNNIRIDKEGTLYSITKDGKLWRGYLDGNSSQLELSDLGTNSLFVVSESEKEKQFIYTNNNRIFILNSNFETINSLDLTNNITNLLINSNNIIFTTKDELYLWNKNKFLEGFPIKSDGYFNIEDIDNDEKINLINTKNGFIYNYELKDYFIK